MRPVKRPSDTPTILRYAYKWSELIKLKVCSLGYFHYPQRERSSYSFLYPSGRWTVGGREFFTEVSAVQTGQV